MKMAPIASFPVKSLLIDTDIESIPIKKLNVSHFAPFEAKKIDYCKPSTAAEFAKFRWERVIKRAHYSMNDDGLPIFVHRFIHLASDPMSVFFILLYFC